MGKVSLFFIKIFKKIWKTKKEKREEFLLKEIEAGNILEISKKENKNNKGNKKNKIKDGKNKRKRSN